MDFRILGPLEVTDQGRTVPIKGRKLQALLTLLLLNAGEVVSRERLIDELWGDEPPPSAAKTLQVHVSRLRRELGEAVVTRGGGYLIEVEPGALDLDRFTQLVDDGRRALAAGEPGRAEERLREALQLWRGPPFAELSDDAFARIEGERLADLRLDAMEERIEAELALGRQSEAIGELEALVARHPYRERPRAQLMLALYREGRQAEALEAYRDARSALVDGLGIEPGPRLQEMHRAILAQDPALDGVERAPAASVAPAPARPPTAPPPRAQNADPGRRTRSGRGRSSSPRCWTATRDDGRARAHQGQSRGSGDRPCDERGHGRRLGGRAARTAHLRAEVGLALGRQRGRPLDHADRHAPAAGGSHDRRGSDARAGSRRRMAPSGWPPRTAPSPSSR